MQKSNNKVCRNSLSYSYLSIVKTIFLSIRRHSLTMFIFHIRYLKPDQWYF